PAAGTASRWWGSSGSRSGTGPGEYRPIRPAAPPPRSAVPAAGCSSVFRARPPRPLPQAGRANAGAADARPHNACLTQYGAQPAMIRRSERAFGPKDLGMRVMSGPVNTLAVLSVLVTGKASTGVHDALVRRARSRDREQALGPRPALTGSSRPDQAPM